MKIIKQNWNFENEPDYIDVLEIIENAARTCYKSEDKIADGSAEKLISALIKNGHHSVLEHVSVSVRVITDRAVTHELVRHRIGIVYSQESQRYVAYRDDVEFILPVEFDNGTDIEWEYYNVWAYACCEAERFYIQMLNRGCQPQLARSVLPNSTKTEIFVTANLREWRHIFNLRCSKKAHPQIRALMIDIRNTFAREYPIFFKDLLTSR